LVLGAEGKVISVNHFVAQFVYQIFPVPAADSIQQPGRERVT
jgi:hypothetical protein